MASVTVCWEAAAMARAWCRSPWLQHKHSPPKQLNKYVVSSPWQVHRAACVQKVVSGLHPHLTLQHL